MNEKSSFFPHIKTDNVLEQCIWNEYDKLVEAR